MIIKRIGVLSMGKVMGCVYAVLGLIGGGVMFVIMSLTAMAGGGRNQGAGAMGGIGALILAPLIYGVIGFLAGLLMAAIYNIAASLIGGVELEFSAERSMGAFSEGAAPLPRPGDTNPFSSPRT